MALRSMAGLTEPHMLELPAIRMATVLTTGDPDKVGPPAIQALYKSINELRRQHPFELEPLRTRWPMQAEEPRDQWVAMWGVPVPGDVEHVPRVDDKFPVHLEDWEYGPVAEVLHVGSYAEEGRTVEKLYRFMREQGYEVLGPHEEEYLTPPEAPVPRTLIRYRIKLV